MGCVSARSTDPDHPNTISTTKFTGLELELLKMMYLNLSKRCRNNQLTRQSFDIFFHSSGLIGEIIFLKFDSSNNGLITFDQFSKAFEVMIKGSFREKADVLFDIYDLQKSGGVTFSELLKILFSYPIEELNKMLLEEPFLKYIGENMLSYYFGAEHKKILEKNIIEEQSEESEQDNLKKKKAGEYIPASEVFCRVKTDQKEEQGKINFLKDPSIFNKKSSSKNSNSNSDKKKKGTTESSVLTIQSFKKSRKNPKIQSNIASLTKKYANFLFTSYNLDKQQDELSKQHFFTLIQEHPALFNVYLAGFHTYIWQTDNNDPQYLKITPYLENYARQVYQDSDDKVYLKFIRTTIFVFDHMKSKIPRQIINMEGLNVVEIEKKGQYGIVFKHRDGIYPPKEYYFESKEIQNEWLRQTSQFKENSIFDQFVKLERIGGGSFSNVFRGKEKKTDKQVAIKVIQNFKLSTGQREVIKRQCGILRNCHHPNIIKFFGEFKTKNSLYIVTEIMNEGDLFDYTKRNGFLQEYEAAIIFRQLVDTTNYLNNDLGIIHRDLKPQNVMIIMNDEKKMVKKIKLIDFGFAVYKDKLNELPLKEKFAGTPGFLAPEIYKQQTYDEKIDTFSLGIILYFMLSGYLPFQSNFLQEIEDMTKNCTYSLVNVHWSNVSDEARDLIQKTLTFKQNRISSPQIAKHPWLADMQQLKQYAGRNKRKGL